MKGYEIHGNLTTQKRAVYFQHVDKGLKEENRDRPTVMWTWRVDGSADACENGRDWCYARSCWFADDVREDGEKTQRSWIEVGGQVTRR